MKRRLMVTLGLLFCAVVGSAEEAGKWVNISKVILGESGGGKGPAISALSVDPSNGDLYVGICKAGIYKSTDQAKTFKKVDGGKYTAMGVNSFSFDYDPEGKRLVFFGMYGDNTITLDSGKTWRKIGNHLDFGMVDWTDLEAKTMFAKMHGRGKNRHISFDGGRTWPGRPEDKFTSYGVFGPKTFIGFLIDALFLSTDSGKEWNKVTRDLGPVSKTTMRIYKGVAYWISPEGLMVSTDQGKTWKVRGMPLRDLIAGPFFGKDEKHMVVVTKKSFFETKNGGRVWTDVAPAVADPVWENDRGEAKGCRFFAWDHINNILYASKLRETAMKFVRAKGK